MQFGNPIIWPLLLVPLATLLFHLRGKRIRAMRDAFAEPEVATQVLPRAVNSATNRRSLVALVCIVLLLALTLLRPQAGFIWRDNVTKGVDIVLAVDVSQSMLAKDITPNRLERAKRKILDLLEMLQGDRVGLVVFSGVAFIETPLTADYSAFRTFVSSIAPDLVPVPGSNFELALTKCLEALGISSNSGADLKPSPSGARAIIMITDGEELSGNLAEVRQTAQDAGVRVYILGVGTAEGAPIPVRGAFKRDESGQVVITKLNEPLLTELATQSGGVYVKSVSNDKDIDTIYRLGIKQSLEDVALQGKRVKKPREIFQIPLFAAVILLVACRMRGLCLFPLLLAAATFFSTRPASAEDKETLGNRARDAYEQSNYKESLKAFSAGESIDKSDPRFQLGAGSSAYRLGRYNEAAESFRRAAEIASESETKAGALYNLGNSLVQVGQYREAVKAYEEALSLTPEDPSVAENLRYTKKLIDEQRKQQQQQKDRQKKESPEKDNQDQSKEDRNNSEKESKDRQNNDEQNSKDENSNDSDSEQKQRSDGQQSNEENREKNDQQNSDAENKNDQSSSPEQQSDPGDGKQNEKQNQSDNNADGEKRPEDRKDQGPEENQASGGSKEAAEEEHQASQAGRSAEEVREESTEETQVRALLNSVEENRKAQMQFRMNRALEELKKEQREYPEKDW